MSGPFLSLWFSHRSLIGTILIILSIIGFQYSGVQKDACFHSFKSPACSIRKTIVLTIVFAENIKIVNNYRTHVNTTEHDLIFIYLTSIIAGNTAREYKEKGSIKSLI